MKITRFTMFMSDLKWALTSQAKYIEPNWSINNFVIETKTGDYIDRATGARSPADWQSIAAVNASFWTVYKIRR